MMKILNDGKYADNNVDFQEYEGKQYNPNYEYGGQVVEYNDDLSIVKIGNKLTVGDKMEILMPDSLVPVEFTIDKLYDTEDNSEIETINPGKIGQTAKMKLPVKCKEGYVIRRKKNLT
jgi:hypothetical protein